MYEYDFRKEKHEISHRVGTEWSQVSTHMFYGNFLQLKQVVDQMRWDEIRQIHKMKLVSCYAVFNSHQKQT